MKRLFTRHWMSLGMGAVLLLSSSRAFAAERVILKYKILQQSVSVRDLTVFGETGQASPDLQSYLKLSRQNPETVRRTLTKPVNVNPVLLDRVLNSSVGNAALDQLGQAIQTPKGGAERQALRSALILSASRDRNISILEVLQNYPTQEVVLDGNRAEGAYRRLNELAERLQNPLRGILRGLGI